MPPHIEIAPLAVRLSNCASWHMDRADDATRAASSSWSGELRDTYARTAERHDAIAFRLFQMAREAA